MGAQQPNLSGMVYSAKLLALVGLSYDGVAFPFRQKVHNLHVSRCINDDWSLSNTTIVKLGASSILLWINRCQRMDPYMLHCCYVPSERPTSLVGFSHGFPHISSRSLLLHYTFGSPSCWSVLRLRLLFLRTVVLRNFIEVVFHQRRHCILMLHVAWLWAICALSIAGQKVVKHVHGCYFFKHARSKYDITFKTMHVYNCIHVHVSMSYIYNYIYIHWCKYICFLLYWLFFWN